MEYVESTWSIWSPHAVHLESTWSPHAVHMECSHGVVQSTTHNFIHFFTSPMRSCDHNLNIGFQGLKLRYSNIIIYLYSTIYIHTLTAKNGLLIYNNIN